MSELHHGARVMHSGIPATHLRSDDGATALVCDHGAQLLSWCPAGGGEALFLSAASRFGSDAAIRGGVPIIFPQFGAAGPGKRHGFARVQAWQFLGAAMDQGSALARWELRGTLVHDAPAGTHGSSDRGFILGVEVRITGAGVDIALTITNPGATAWQCHAALHTYLRVDDLGAVTLEGLQGRPYVDQTVPGETAPSLAQISDHPAQQEAQLRFAGEVDRVYPQAPERLSLRDAANVLIVSQRGFRDTVVWNPGADKAAALTDLEPGGERHFVCIEAAAVSQPLILGPGATWRGVQQIQQLRRLARHC